MTGAQQLLRTWARQFMLTPIHPYLWQFVSYAFMHAGIWHILGNMFFLYLFGNNVNDKLGHIGYLAFYLAGAVFSGVGHALISTEPVLGASGAIACVIGAYLVLFPQTLITVFYWLFYFVGTTEIPALYFIVVKLIFWDNVLERGIPNVAYDAHLSGYVFGAAAILIMLATGLVEASSFDLWAMLKRWNRQRVYRDIVAGGYDPFAGRTARRIQVTEAEKTKEERQKQEQIERFRSEISTRINQRNLPQAASLYLELTGLDPNQILPRQHLLDIANQLASEHRYAESAQVYEKFLAHYGTYEYVEQVELMLGIIYSRYLHRTEAAIKHLQAAEKHLSNPDQLKMCRDELSSLGA
jgi:membrane associated rhomboid family serine protease